MRNKQIVVNKPIPATVNVYTVQSIGQLSKARARGWIAGKPPAAFMDEEDLDTFGAPYEFMKSEMGKRIPHFSGDWPVWAWPDKWDLRDEQSNTWNQDKILVYANVPKYGVLASDFGGWHCCLGNHVVVKDEHEWDAIYGDGKPDPPQEEVIASWHKIFDVTSFRKKDVQLCVDRIYLSEIKALRHVSNLGSKIKLDSVRDELSKWVHLANRHNLNK